MDKLMRFLILAIIYIVCMVIFYMIPAAIFWLFGAPFLECLQNPGYVFIIGIAVNAILGAVFHDCFDGDFLAKD